MPGCGDCEVKCEKAKRKQFKKFVHAACEYYPCHSFTDLNCLFCFCPLYTYQNCGGNFTVLDNGIKDCSNCQLPHTDDGYEYIVKFLKDLNLHKAECIVKGLQMACYESECPPYASYFCKHIDKVTLECLRNNRDK